MKNDFVNIQAGNLAEICTLWVLSSLINILFNVGLVDMIQWEDTSVVMTCMMIWVTEVMEDTMNMEEWKSKYL